MARRPLPPATPFPTVEASWPDPDWSPNSPDWIKANVWSAQYTALKVNQQEPRELSLNGSRCAACASPGGTLCSRCMQVCFCNRACQRAAWPVHKHYCQPVEEQSMDFDLKPVQALRIAFEMEAPAEGDGMTTDLRRLCDIARSTEPAVQTSLPCGQACLWIGLCWACMDHVPQGWSFLRRACDIGCQLRNWNLEGRALLYQVQTCRHFDLKGVTQDMLTCCLEASAAAQARQDIYLEGAASQVFGLMTIEMDETEGKSLLSSSLKLWVGMLKAACLRACGNASPTIEQMTQMPPTDPVRTCARSLVNILVRLAEAYETLETPDLAESALRQALEYASLTGRPRYEQRVLLALSMTFEYHQTARRQQSVRDKAAIYRQHLYAAAPNLAQPQCAMCRGAMNLLEPTRVAHGLGKRISVLPCWHAFHFECSDLWTRMHGTCPLCRKDIKLIMYGIEQNCRDQLTEFFLRLNGRKHCSYDVHDHLSVRTRDCP